MSSLFKPSLEDVNVSNACWAVCWYQGVAISYDACKMVCYAEVTNQRRLCLFSAVKFERITRLTSTMTYTTYNVSSSHMKNTRCQTRPFCALSTQWFSSCRYRSDRQTSEIQTLMPLS